MAIQTTSEWNLRQQRKRVLREMRELLLEGVMRGSIVENVRRCGKKNCACATDPKRRHRRRMVSVNVHGRTRTGHVDEAHLARVQQATARYRRMWRLLDEVTEIEVKLLAYPLATPENG
jgi:hypothetical protein